MDYGLGSGLGGVCFSAFLLSGMGMDGCCGQYPLVHHVIGTLLHRELKSTWCVLIQDLLRRWIMRRDWRVSRRQTYDYSTHLPHHLPIRRSQRTLK